MYDVPIAMKGVFVAEYCMSCMAPLRGAAACPECGFDGASENAAHQLAAGTVLGGRYLVGNAIGQGGFGITYIGRDLTLNLRVAVKEYYPAGYANRNVAVSDALTVSGEESAQQLQKGRERFLSEARVMAKFYGSPGVVDVRDFFEANDTAYIIMEYLDGEDLRVYLGHERLAAEQVFRMMEPIMDVLERIHAENVVHRDISPDNIMLLGDGSLRLMDFGAARVFDYADQHTVSILLKAGYAPEEQYRARGEQGPWTDIYALCATIYKCITGITLEDSLQRLHEDRTVWPSELHIDITPAQEAALKKGLAPRAQDRFRSIAQMREALGMPAVHVSPSRAFARETPAPFAEAEVRDFGAHPQTLMLDDSPTFDEDLPAAAAEEASETLSDDPPGPITVVNEALSAPVSEGAAKGRARRFRLVAAATSAVAALAVIVAVVASGILNPAEYTVSFDTAGGSEIAPVTAGDGASIDEPAAPIRANFEFAGWYLDAPLTAKAAFPLAVDSDIELHAAWNEVLTGYTVRYLDKSSKKAVKKKKSVSGKHVGDKVTQKAPAVSGYDLDSKERQSITLKAKAADNVISFYYEKRAAARSSASSSTGSSSASAGSSASSGSSSGGGSIDWDA